MWLWYDWQAAAVADEHGHLVDVMQWDGHMTEHAVVERLRLIASGQPIREAVALHDRFPEAVLSAHSRSDRHSPSEGNSVGTSTPMASAKPWGVSLAATERT